YGLCEGKFLTVRVQARGGKNENGNPVSGWMGSAGSGTRGITSVQPERDMTRYAAYVLHVKPRMAKWIHKWGARVWRDPHSSDYLARYMPHWLHIRAARASELL